MGIVAGAWGIDHVSVGCVPHRATGVRPERAAWPGGSSLAYECVHGAVEEVVVGFFALAALFLFEGFECECVAEFGVAAFCGADGDLGGLVALVDGA